MKRMLVLFIFLLSLITTNTATAEKEVAMTIDDLPFVGNAKGQEGNLRRERERFMAAVEVLRKYNIPAVGFTVAGSIEQGQQELLQEFMQGGNLIGNHTYTHPSLNRITAENYITNVDKADQRLAPLMGQEKFFRYPFLAEGNSQEKYVKVRDYLKSKNYIVAPVTIDSKDYKFNARLLNINWRVRKQYINSIRNQYLGFISRQIDKAEKMALKQANRPIKQVLLIHMNYLNAYLLEDVIQLFKNKGYTFIPLSQALKDPFYKTYRQRYGAHALTTKCQQTLHTATACRK